MIIASSYFAHHQNEHEFLKENLPADLTPYAVDNDVPYTARAISWRIRKGNHLVAEIGPGIKYIRFYGLSKDIPSWITDIALEVERLSPRNEQVVIVTN